jgi:ABC-2 type transport system ATP-binding protein
VIEVEGLVKVYGGAGRRSVDHLSFRVAAGEVFAFLGPNGAGKSTTAKILTTLLKPTAGTATVAGHDVVRASRKVRESIGYVAQSAGIDFFMTGRENLALIGHLYHLKGDALENRVDAMLDYFHLTDVADDMVASYSGGMQRKLDIATALLHRPQVLFLDEPTLGLDAQSRIDLWNYVRRLNTELGVTVFLTTHYLDEADRLAHRVGIIDQGVLQAVGTPGELKDMLKGDSIALTFEGDAKARALHLLRDAPFAKEVLDEEEGVRVYVDNGGETVATLISLLAREDIRVKAVTLARPTLDDVFIKFTGRSLDKVEEKVRPWWAQWAGDNWEQAQAQGDWKGNQWVGADGTPKDREAFEAWSREQAVAGAGSNGAHPLRSDAGAAGTDAAGTPETVEDDMEAKQDAKDQKPEGGGWAGNEWVNADGTPKDPEAMAKWLKETGASKGAK